MTNYNKNIPSFVYFYAEWCGHCQNFMPIWKALENMVPKNELNMVKISCVENQDYCNKINSLKGYPTLYFVPTAGSAFMYRGDRSPESLIDFINNSMNKQLIKI